MVFDTSSILLAAFFALLAFWRHYRAADLLGVRTAEVVVAQSEIFDVRHFKLRQSERKFPLQARLPELVAFIYFLVAIFFLVESPFDFISGFEKADFLENITPFLGHYWNVTLALFCVLAIGRLDLLGSFG
ncbi:MAG: hypothetical protein H6887_02475 [Hoeflea sp.]|nr:hypothetical protein [Hyphomicrobiaceae bacterium]MCC0034117.1 hypothetical protein [Hoeflea sp.]